MMLRVGVISSINADRGTVRVTFPDRDDMVSDELPVLCVGGLFAMPAVGRPAVCLMHGGGSGSGYFVGTIYTDGAPDGPILEGDLRVTGQIFEELAP